MDKSKTFNQTEIRDFLILFYKANDSNLLERGFDVTGLVEFTIENGVDVLNRMLLKKYGVGIYLYIALNRAKLKQQSEAYNKNKSDFLLKKENEFRIKIISYLSVHKPNLIEPSQSATLDKFVKFAVYSGLRKLSDKFERKFKKPIPGADEEFNNFYNLDIYRLREDLKSFYIETEDIEQLEVLDDNLEWACEVGIDEVDKRLLKLYGKSLSQFNESQEKEPHFNKAEEIDSNEDVGKIIFEPEFEDMSDLELLCELRAFYDEHDPENIKNLHQVLYVARSIGRTRFNTTLQNVYNQILLPMPLVKEKVKLPPVFKYI